MVAEHRQYNIYRHQRHQKYYHRPKPDPFIYHDICNYRKSYGKQKLESGYA